MDTAPNTLSDRTRARDTILPNLRGEDETEISYLVNLIETQAWILFPSKHPTCVIGRFPSDSTEDPPKFCAALYTMGKGGVKSLDCGPKMGTTRKEALMRLLGSVENDIGKIMVGDKREKREREEGRGGRGGGGN
ncbi:hypothetical protein BDU57DRAFT_572656 [Ampelomyces quisqualis]|uniref:Uncharacterized protein n=1 Tax=Ampelomyces quisqualis TaxID=50730 RepID=A0A6A5QX71_AMPQU|nr:hypothetical protein BDU57DRAFT_572656 [Ampelomyces quisqualis]